MMDFDGVSKRYGRTQRPALADVTLRIDAGEFAFLVGASGSGKSTLMRLVLCEERPTAGRITVAGREVTSMRRRHVPRLRRDIGMVFQDYRLLPDKTVHDNIAYVMHVLGHPGKVIRRAVAESLELVRLTEMARRLPHELSGGEQQRVAIARAVVKRPTLLLADEPTGNLDPATSLGIVSLLDDINGRGTTVVMATHDEEIVNQLRKRVIELDNGAVVRDQDRGGYNGGRR